jgi:hypothetical protein
MKKITIAYILGVTLSGCGGGGTVSDIATQPIILKTFSNGSGVVVGSPDLGSAGGPSNLVIAASDVEVAAEVAGGTLALTATGQTVDGKYYIVTREGTASNGVSLTVVTEGITLSEDLREYTAMSLVTINNELGLTSSGSKPTNLPTGTHSYTGYAVVSAASEAGNGTVTLTANFNERIANVAANIPANSASGNSNAYFFSANGMNINVRDGSFSTANARIGEVGKSPYTANIKGYFAGSNAKGAHGLVYGNDSTAQMLGVFAADR